MNVPAELKYTKSHEWIRIDGDTATVGITDHAQSELGDIVFVELPSVGQSLVQNQTFGSVESVKTVSDVYAPIAGTVTEFNSKVGSQSEVMNSDPYGDGWLIKIKMANPADADSLLDAQAYSAIVG